MKKNRIYPDLSRKNLGLIAWLRNIAIIGQMVTVLVTTHLLEIPLSTEPMWGIIAAQGLINIYTWLRLRQASAKPVSQHELFGHLLIDIMALYGLLYFSGGASNPFASLFIVQVVIAAIVLPPVYTWCIATLTIVLYTLLLLWNVQVPYFLHHHIGNYFNIHVQGMWISFILLAVLVAGFIVRISEIARRQEQLLAEAERIGALGALAANAAHELGTPLATIALLAQQYEADAQSDEQKKRAGILRQQVVRCKEILTRITAAGGVMRAESGQPMPLDIFFGGIADNWQQQKTHVELLRQFSGTQPAPVIVAEYALTQAITNLLNNAADAGAQTVRMYAQWSAQHINLTIEDNGSGIAASLLEILGQPGVSGKEPGQGLGLGLFLARSVVSRLGGSLTIDNRSEGGARAWILLPLDRLRV